MGRPILKPLILISLCGMLGGCLAILPRRTDVSRDAPFVSSVGGRYRSKTELVMMSYSKKGLPYVSQPGTAGSPRLDEMTGKKVPYKFYGEWVWGVVPSGTVFEIEKIVREENYAGRMLAIHAKVLESRDQNFAGKQVDLVFLFELMQTSSMPAIAEDTLEPLGR
jgi:hypothetical protein